MSLFCWTQRKIFWRKFVIRLFWGTIDFHSRKKKYYGSQWCPRTALFPTFFRISSFVFSRTKTFIQVWNYLRVSKWWQNFHFWVNYPFNFPSPSFFLMAFALAGGRDNDLLLLITCHSHEIASVSKRQQSNQFFMVLHIFLFREAVSLG